MPYIIGWLFLSALNKQGLRTRIEITFVSKFRSVLLGDVLARRVPVSAFCRYRVSLQQKKCRQQIIGLNDESFSVRFGPGNYYSRRDRFRGRGYLSRGGSGAEN